MYTFYGVSLYKHARSRPLGVPIRQGMSAQNGCVTDQTGWVRSSV
jgi:hypothetical protein